MEEHSGRYYLINSDVKSVGRDGRVALWFTHGFAATGGAERYGKALGHLEKGDVVLLYENQVGLIGVGDVLEPWNGKTVEPPLYYLGYLQDGWSEYHVAVDWWCDLREQPIPVDTLRDHWGFAPTPHAVRPVKTDSTKVVELVQSLRASSARRPRAQHTHLGRPYEDVGTMERTSPAAPFEIDPDKVDRGIQAHATTQDALADFLRSAGINPRGPTTGEPEYDLAWEWNDETYVAEVKSVTEENEEKQLRLGLGQVLRYRQLLGKTGRRVVAVLVPEREPERPGWQDLCRDLSVELTWPGAFESLLTPRS